MTDRTPEEVLELIRRSGTGYSYFFEHAGPEWLDFLVGHEFFCKPPPAKRGPDWIQFPNWPESQYLVRVSRDQAAKVFEIAKSIPETDNVRVHEDIARIASNLPGEMAAHLSRRVTTWLETQFGALMSLPTALSELVIHLSDEAQVNEAFRLADVLLEVQQSRSDYSHEIASRVDSYEYSTVLGEVLPGLVKADRAQAFRFLCDKLEEAVNLGYTHKESGYDTTGVWRPSIPAHAQNAGHSTLDVLVDATRDFAISISQTDASGAELVSSELKSRTAPIFRRISLFVSEQCASDEEVATLLSDPDLACSLDLWHEYSQLLELRFPMLPPELQESVLDMLGSDEVQETLFNRISADVDDAERTDLLKRWQRDRLALISTSLSGEWSSRWSSLVAELGAPEHPDFLHYTTTGAGSQSPYNLDELRDLSPDALVAIIAMWKPEQIGFREPTADGFATTITALISSDGAKFSAQAEAFVGLEPQFVAAVISGFRNALRDSQTLDWESIALLCKSLMNREPSASDTDSEASVTYLKWAKQEVAWLVNDVLKDQESCPPFDLRLTIWDLIGDLADDENPDPEHERRYGGSNMDPLQLSLNTIRGQAMHAVFRYALWVERVLDATDAFAGVDSYPEVDAVLRRHLDTSIDSSLAVRAVYGQWFPQLVRIDAAWAAELAEMAFPSDEREREYFAAAWITYVWANRVYDTVFDTLRDKYRTAIRRVPNEGPGRYESAADERLGDHLVVLYVRGQFELSDDGLLARYWSQAPVALKRAVIRNIGISFESVSELTEDEQLRLQALWEWIRKSTSDDQREALSDFGEWMRAEALDVDWLLTETIDVLTEQVPLETAFVVYDRLVDLVEDYTPAVLEILRLMVLNANETWDLIGSEKRITRILEVALESDDESIRSKASDVLNLLGAKGLNDLRQLAEESS